MKLGIASKMQTNVAKLFKCHDELKIMTSQKISAYNYKITSEMKSMKNQKKTMLEFLNAIRSELTDNQAQMFQLEKLTMKMCSLYNNCPISKIIESDAFGFAMSFADCYQQFANDTQFITVFKLL